MAPRVHGEHHALAAEAAGELADQLRPLDGGGVDPDLVGAGAQETAGVLLAAHAAADGQRDEDLLGGAPDPVDVGVALLGGGADVEEDDLVRPLLGIAEARTRRGRPGRGGSRSARP